MTGEQMMKMAGALNWEGVNELWRRVRRGEDKEWPDGRALEYLLVRAFELEKATVRWPYQVTYTQRFGTLEQIDGAVHHQGRGFLIESKRRDTERSLPIEALAKLRFRLESRPPGTMAILFSTTEFSTPTEVFAQFCVPLNVLLWGPEDIDRALHQRSIVSALSLKLTYAIEEGLPNYPLGEPA